MNFSVTMLAKPELLPNPGARPWKQTLAHLPDLSLAPIMGAMASRVVPCWPCGGDTEWSTHRLEFWARTGGILEDAAQSNEFQQHLAKFLDPTQPLDLAYASIHTHWVHMSNIPLRSLRL